MSRDFLSFRDFKANSVVFATIVPDCERFWDLEARQSAKIGVSCAQPAKIGPAKKNLLLYCSRLGPSQGIFVPNLAKLVLGRRCLVKLRHAAATHALSPEGRRQA